MLKNLICYRGYLTNERSWKYLMMYPNLENAHSLPTTEQLILKISITDTVKYRWAARIVHHIPFGSYHHNQN